jgi:hypothetical protein
MSFRSTRIVNGMVEPARIVINITNTMKAYWEALDSELPAVRSSEGDAWCRWIDTTLESPLDIVE